MTICVLTVDDHAVVRARVAAALANDSGVDVVGEATDGDEGLVRFLELRPDVVLMDLRMPELDDVAATRAILAAELSAENSDPANSITKSDDYL